MTYLADELPAGLDEAAHPYATTDGLVGDQGGDALRFPIARIAEAVYAAIADSDASLAADSNDLLPTKSAVKAYVSAHGPLQCIPIACGDETTAIATGTAKVTFRMPFAFTLTDVRASVTTAPTGSGNLTIDVNEGGTTILSTKLTFDASEKTTTTAATPRVISDTSLADDAEITIDVDAVSGTVTGAGLKVYLIGRPT